MSWIVAVPLVVVGVLVAALGWRDAARHVRATSGWARWCSSAMLLPATGVLLVAAGVLYGLDLPTVFRWLAYAVVGAAVLATVTAVVRALRAGERRRAAWTAGGGLVLLVAGAVITLGPDDATPILTAVVGGVLLIVGVVIALRRWPTADTAGRRELLSSVALGAGFSCQAVGALLPAQLRPWDLVLTVLGAVSLAVALGLILAGRRRQASTKR